MVIVPSMAFDGEGEWTPGRYPKLVRWLRDMYDGGATICSACTGGNLAAETGLLDGHPRDDPLDVGEQLPPQAPPRWCCDWVLVVVAGDDGRLITSGAATRGTTSRCF